MFIAPFACVLLTKPRVSCRVQSWQNQLMLWGKRYTVNAIPASNERALANWSKRVSIKPLHSLGGSHEDERSKSKKKPMFDYSHDAV